jgi:hypothetical protein
MLRKPFVSVFIRLLVKARENPFRFEMLHRTPGNPTTVNRVQQPAAKNENSYAFKLLFLFVSFCVLCGCVF